MQTQKIIQWVMAVLLAISLPGVSEPALAQKSVQIDEDGRPAKDLISQMTENTFVPMSFSAPDCSYGGLISSIEAIDSQTVTFNLCRAEAAFLSKIAMSSFAIYQKDWIAATSGATNRTTIGLQMPVGTGPYKVSAWDEGNSITFVKNPDYWGAAPETDTLVFTWSPESADRLLALQDNTIDGFDDVDPEDYATVQADADLQLAMRPGLNTFYIGMTNTFTPFNDVRVRQAVAMGIDRQQIVDTFFPPGSEVATHFTPCAIPNGCAGDDWYTFNPVAAQALLAEAGYPDGFNTKIYYRDVQRIYLPHVNEVAQNIQAQLLANLSINAQIVVMESGTFVAEAGAGHLNGFHLLGWAADFPHVSNFLDFHFGENHYQFGNPAPAIYDNLNDALQFADPLLAEPYYTSANNAIRDIVPMVPVAHGGLAVAYRADVTDPQAGPLADFFAVSDPGGRATFRWMQSAEPLSLFCADEADSDSFRACDQVMQTLYTYENDGAGVEPALAESCTPSEDLTSWTCILRQNVKFHDGSLLDANDVVATFAMGLDVTSQTHKGHSNSWGYYNFIFGLVNEQTFFKSSGTYDGWILESSEISGMGGTKNSSATTLRVGDDAANRQYRAILSFDTSALPETAVITSITLKFKYAGISGTNPFTTHGKLLVDICTGAFKGAPVLELGDFKATCTPGKNKLLTFSKTKVDNWYSQSFNPLDFQYLNLGGVTQFRLRFNLDDNNDFGSDYLKLYSGNALEADRPQLIIEYYVP